MLNLGRQQTNIFLILISIIVVLTVILFMKNVRAPSLELIEENSDDIKPGDIFKQEKELEHKQIPENIKVYITGQIKKPGVIEVQEGSRLIDVIELAGGLLEEADTDKINLALKVEDEGMYIIPKIGDEAYEGSMANLVNEESKQQMVNINKASAEELQTLHGIGPSKAKAIIEYRKSQGLFTHIEDIKKVPGIGERTFEQISDSITLK